VNLRKRTSRQVRGGERVQSLIFDLTAAEFRAVALRDELVADGQDELTAAVAALTTVARPSPLFVAWLSDGRLTVLNGQVNTSTDWDWEILANWLRAGRITT